MAKISSTTSSSNSSNRAAMKASCYSVDASSMALHGFHYSTTGAGGADSGMPSPPASPPLAAYHELNMPKKVSSARRGGAACTIAEECERLFCETLRTIFLGEGNLACQDSLATGMCNNDDAIDDYINYHHRNSTTAAKRIGNSCVGTSNSIGLPSPPDAPDVKGINGAPLCCSAIEQWIEVWDYVGGARFRGFVADNGDEKNMFVFFDAAATVKDLKPGLISLIELCSLLEFDCTRLNICLDRAAAPDDMKGLMKDLGWIGFEPVTLAEWTDKPPIVSDMWLFLGMEV
ncbi:ornithine decarboxylase antizyme-domain-containing protein [Phyllosticta capitalensis]|uniref:Ornithine decarboxylase antizyme n=1 Tax=Phyllosticta capitalensis TaxID=121624 RepID=A0ABR1YEB0_9PEZI